MSDERETDDARLLALWHSPTLDEKQWTELYQRVRAQLLRAHAPELEALADDREDCICDFFTQKVLFNARGPLQHANVLNRYFRRYLLDRIDERRRAPLPLSALFDDDERVEAVLPACPSGIDDDAFERLRQASGLEAAAVAAAARAFLEALDDDDFAYLVLHQCPDNGMPLSKVAKSRQIAAYHHRARKLGITLRKADTPADYARSQLGRWLTETLHLQPLAEHQAEVLTAFNILCLEALRLQQQRL